MPTIAHLLARYVADLNYEQFDKETIQAVKRDLIDTIGNAIGGYDSQTVGIVEQAVDSFDMDHGVTLWGKNKKSAPLLSIFYIVLLFEL